MGRPGGTPARLRDLLLGVAGVFVLSVLAVHLRPAGSALALWWPAAAVATALLLRLPAGRWRVVGVLAVGTTSSIANAVAGRPPEIAVPFGTANALEAVVVCWLLTRGGAVPGVRTMPQVGRFVLACAAGAATAGVAAGTAAARFTGQDLLTTAQTVGTSHGSALLLLLPVTLGAVRLPGEAGWAERGLQSLVLALFLWASFGPGQDLPLSLLPGAALVWASLRCGSTWTAAQTLLTGLAVSAATLAGWGPYAAYAAAKDDPLLAVVLVQAFVLINGCLVLASSAVVEERRQAMDEVRRLASHDTLTGAGNRRLLDDRLADALALADRGQPSTLLLLDLDGFKAVNDTDGHLQGDRVLVAVADRLRTLLRPTDTVARLGGDEFVVLLRGVAWPSAQAHGLVQRIAAAVAVPVDGSTVPVGVSTGAVAVRAGAVHDALLREADAAMYGVKQSRGVPAPRSALRPSPVDA